MKYKFTVPATSGLPAYGSTCADSPAQTHRQAALAEYNQIRAREGLPMRFVMPAGTTYTPVTDWEVQQHTTEGWECVHTEETCKAAKAAARNYMTNQPGTYRVQPVHAR